MSGFRLRINALENIPQASAIQAPLSRQAAFEVEYFFRGQGNYTVVQPMLVSNVVVFLVDFPEGEESPMALVYNSRDEWSDIEKESTGLTDAIGQAIENYYSNGYLPDHFDPSSEIQSFDMRSSGTRSSEIKPSEIKSFNLQSSNLQSSEIHLLN